MQDGQPMRGEVRYRAPQCPAGMPRQGLILAAAAIPPLTAKRFTDMIEKQKQQQSSAEGPAEALRRVAEVAPPNAPTGTELGAETARRAGESVAGQTSQVIRQAADALEVYKAAAWRIAREAQILAIRPFAAVVSAQEMQRVWTEWLQRTLLANARFSQQALGARSLAEMAQLHTQLLEEHGTALREGSARVLAVAGNLAAPVRAPLPREGTRPGQPQAAADARPFHMGSR